ncbi:MAG: zinc ribbon domain-containing protein [Planctomycetes bacterium]|nr:zinc ribbon domain-containing protein [Planctomycetota bacterium]
MPTYHYRAVEDEAACDACRETFSKIQTISEPLVEQCSSCEAPVRRVICAAGGSLIDKRYKTKKMLSDGNLKKLGFKKLVKESDGKYVDVLQD